MGYSDYDDDTEIVLSRKEFLEAMNKMIKELEKIGYTLNRVATALEA